MSHYSNFNSIRSIDDIRSIFPDAEANWENWCLFSTSGVHGTYLTLEDIEKEYENGNPFSPSLTVLIIRPRLVSMLYGNIHVKEEDIPYLRSLCRSSLEAIKASQEGNI